MEGIQNINAYTYRLQNSEIPAAKTQMAASGEGNAVQQVQPVMFNSSAPKLERVPAYDTVSFSGKNKTADDEPLIIKPGAGAVIGGVVAGATAQSLISAPQKTLSMDIMGRMSDLCHTLKPDEVSQVENAVINTIKESGLEAKGVGIIKATAKNSKEISEIMKKEIDNGFLKYLPEDIKKVAASMMASPIKAGKNACYTFASKKIIMPEKELGLALFHETGHAMNANLSTAGKILQKCRPMTLLALPIALIALCKTKKAPGEKPKNGVDKATTFIKDNAGKLTFAAFLPMLIEEGLASVKGHNYAKKLLSPELAKKVAKTNMFGFSTYLLAAVLSSLGIYAGVKIKDAIAHREAVPVKNS